MVMYSDEFYILPQDAFMVDLQYIRTSHVHHEIYDSVVPQAVTTLGINFHPVN